MSVQRLKASISRGQQAAYVVQVSTENNGSVAAVTVALTAQPSSQKPAFTSGCAKSEGTASCTVSSVSDKKPASLKQFVRDRPGHDRRYSLDSTRLRAVGWTPHISFEEGLRSTIDWYVDHEEWWRPLKSGEFWDFYRRNYKPADPVGS